MEIRQLIDSTLKCDNDNKIYKYFSSSNAQFYLMRDYEFFT